MQDILKEYWIDILPNYTDTLFSDELFSNLDVENIKIATSLINKACEKNNAGFILVSLGEEYFFNYDKKLIL